MPLGGGQSANSKRISRPQVTQATEDEEFEINVGDVVHVKAGEKHWHGAKVDTTMGHITITALGSKATWL